MFRKERASTDGEDVREEDLGLEEALSSVPIGVVVVVEVEK